MPVGEEAGMPRIPPTLVADIIRKTDLTATLSHYMRLRPQGRKFLALCPFHPEKTPSLNFDPDSGLFYCFGCKAGGDFIKLIMQLEGWTFTEAVRELGRRVGIEIEEMSSEERQQYDQKQRLRDVLERACALFHRILVESPNAQHARDYLHKRGITAATIETFELGYAPPGPCFLVDRMRQKGIDMADVLGAGMAVDRNGRAVDMFRDRVTFPIRDAHGQRIAMGGRLLGDGQPKYLNSPETALFSKRTHLYGLYQARSHVRDAPAVLVEGYMDVIAMHQGGFPQAVASLGTALTPEQAKLLRRYCESCVLAYDADRAGEHATDKGIEVFEQAELTVRVMRLPPGDDPDSLIRNEGPPAVQKRLDAALGLVEYRMLTLEERSDVKSPEGSSHFIRDMIPALRKIKDTVRLERYVSLIQHKTKVPEATIHKLLRIHTPPGQDEALYEVYNAPPPSSALPQAGRYGGFRGQSGGFGERPRGDGRRGNFGRRPPPPCEPPPLAAPGRAASHGMRTAERNLLAYLLANPAMVPAAREAVSADELDDPVAQALLRYLYAMPVTAQPLVLADFIPLLTQDVALNPEGVDRKLSELVLAKDAEPLTPELFAGTLRYFQKRREQAELRVLRRSVTPRIGVSISHDDPEYVRLDELHQRLKKDETKGS